MTEEFCAASAIEFHDDSGLYQSERSLPFKPGHDLLPVEIIWSFFNAQISSTSLKKGFIPFELHRFKFEPIFH